MYSFLFEFFIFVIFLPDIANPEVGNTRDFAKPYQNNSKGIYLQS